MGAPTQAQKAQFAGFELDMRSHELAKNGHRIRLQGQPFQVLRLLLDSNGELVLREEFRTRLWPEDTFVDFDHGLNQAISKLRDALDSSRAGSSMIETLPRCGYRFVPSVEWVQPTEESAASSAASSNGGTRGTTAALATPDISGAGAFPIQDSDGKKARYPRTWRALGWVGVAGMATALGFFILLGVGARGWEHRILDSSAKPEIQSVAVLPLDNLSGDPNQEYFAEGMTDELTTMLAKNSSLRITSRTSAMQYKGAHRPLSEIAEKLGVDGIVEGSVARTGDTVHMTLQLIHAPSDTHVWAESYDREANDVASLPREAAQAIAKRLHSAVLQITPQRYVSPEAHDAYLHGRYLWFLDKNDEAGPYLKKATELQPDYALGWSGLADYYAMLAMEGTVSSKESLALEKEAATRAVALDPTLPEAHLALGAAILFGDWDWAQADQEMGRAIELNPRYAEAYHLRAKMYTALNCDQEAIEAQKKSTELDPFARPYGMAVIYFLARQYDAAIQDARRRLEALPQDAGLHWTLYEAYRRKGAKKEAAQQLEKELRISGDKVSAANVRRAYEQGGSPAVVRWQVRQLEKKSATQLISPADLALLYAQLGRREKTLAILQESYRRHEPQLLWVQTDPAFDFLHSDERYRSVIRRIGLPPAW